MAKKNRQSSRELERVRRARERQRLYVMLGVGAVILLVVAAAGFYWMSTQSSTSGQVASGACGPIGSPADEGRQHLIPGQTPSYSSNPPASGSHNPNPQPRGIYDSPIDVTAEVHSLEHGYVVIHYNNIASDQLQQLKDIVSRDPRKMILSPYPSLPSRISLTSWDHLQTCTAVDSQAIASFVAQFRDQGPESTPE